MFSPKQKVRIKKSGKPGVIIAAPHEDTDKFYTVEVDPVRKTLGFFTDAELEVPLPERAQQV